ncbi:MAG: hypothetical protein HYZ34_02800 [Ignavibacteriae bacterium]|nr:hypothetical protein [Ignavibacteriota bacterium]
MIQTVKQAKRFYPFRELRYLYSDKKRPDAVQMHIDDFLGLMETLQILNDKKLMKSIKRGLDEVRQGALLSHAEVFD